MYMISNQQLLLAKKISASLAKTNHFNYIMLDNWRGWCLIYDIKKSRPARKKQAVWLIQKYSKYKLARLKKANRSDKKIFGLNEYLNCRSLNNYKRCYINWLIKRVSGVAEARQELDLLCGFRIYKY